jgi:hypothetical protein
MVSESAKGNGILPNTPLAKSEDLSTFYSNHNKFGLWQDLFSIALMLLELNCAEVISCCPLLADAFG